MRQNIHLPDAELAVMQALWSLDGKATRPILDEILFPVHGWSATTVLNLLERIKSKGFIKKQPQKRGFLYIALITQEDYKKQESKNVLSKIFNGSVKQFVAALDGGESLSQQDIAELYEYLQQLKNKHMEG